MRLVLWAAFWVLGALATAQPAHAQSNLYGAAVIEGAIALKEAGRYKSTKDWDKTLQFYRRVFPNGKDYLWRRIASTPKVRAMHIENRAKKRTWDGINLYETDGNVFIFILKTEAEPTAPPPKKPG